MTGAMPGVEAIIQRFKPVPDGYLMAVRLAATVEITDWHVEFVMPDGVQVQAGRDTTLEQRPLSYIAIPAHRHLMPSGAAAAAGAVYIAVGDQRAPTRLRVKANGVNTGGYATVTGVYVTGQRGRLVTATEQWWPGSTVIKMGPGGWEHSGGGGFGGGGGGGGGGQSELFVDVDERGILREIRHKTDGGGGGGAGGGGGWGEAGADYAASGQRQGQAEQGDSHQSGNPLTQLQATVDDLVKRMDAIERKIR